MWSWDEETDEVSTFMFPADSQRADQEGWCTAKSGCNWQGTWGTTIATESDCTDVAGVAQVDGLNYICAECMNGSSDCWEVSKKGACVFSNWASGAENMSSQCGEAGTVFGENSGERFHDWE